MICEKCKINEATVLIQQSINGKIEEYHLCPECASKNYQDISFDNLLQGFLNNFMNQSELQKNIDNVDKPEQSVKCQMCGMTLENIMQMGKIGCPKCYEVFSTELSEVIKSIQGSDEHKGKYPQKSKLEMDNIRRLEYLKTQLKENIKEERYELAANLRDEIKILEREVSK